MIFSNMLFRSLFSTLVLTFLGLSIINAQSIQGPATVAVGQTATYTYSNGLTVPAATWIITKGTKVSQSSSGTTYTVNVTWNSSGSGRLELRGKEPGRNSEYYTVDSKVITILSAPPLPTATFTTPDYQCQQTFVTRSSPPADAIYDWFWQTSPTGTDISSEAAAVTKKLTTTSSLYLRARFKTSPNTWSGSAQQVSGGAITVYTKPVRPTAAINGYRFGTGLIDLSVSTVAGATGYKWYTSDVPGTSYVPNVNSNSYQFELTQPTVAYFVASISGPCESADRTVVNGFSYALPTISVTNGGIIRIDAPVTLSTQLFDSYVWKNSTGEIISTASTFTTSTSGIYTVTVTKNGATATSEPVSVGFYLDSQNRNYVLSNRLLIKEQNPYNIYSLSSEKNQRVIQYIDEIGRIEQTVQVQASPSGKDVVRPSVYNTDGLEYRKFLPFAHSANDGLYKDKTLILSSSDDYIGEARDFYNNAGGNVAVDAKPYAENIYEKSPMKRVIETGSYGTAWQPSTGINHTVDYEYKSNGASEVLLWTWNRQTKNIEAQQAGALRYYEPNQLYVTKITDENDHETFEYKDKLGKTVLKKNQISTSNYALTYYIYDAMGNLSVVLPPEAVTKLTDHYFAASESSKAEFLGKYAYVYRFDYKGRLATKKIPGADSIYYIYDRRNRLVLSQDGNQRSGNTWIFTKYDEMDRIIMSGIYTHNVSVSQRSMQDFVNTQVATNAFIYEVFDGSSANHGYSNRAFPTTGSTNAVFYFDTYGFLSLTEFASLNYDANHLSGESKTACTIGAPTGSKRLILNTTSWLCTANYYNKLSRLIQTMSSNSVGGFDRKSSLYDFSGHETRAKTTHSGSGHSDVTQVREFSYDSQGRLKDVTMSINGQTPVVIEKNTYNELGQLVDRKLHSTQIDGSNAKQSVDFRYNIRGWLTSINNATLSVGSANDDQGDFFGMELAYNSTLPNISITPQYNGNITSIKWSNETGSGAVKQRAYKYEYDGLNRLKNAFHYTNLGLQDVWASSTSFNESDINYDPSGNILSLKRSGTSGAVEDELTYHYNGNALMSIDDNASATDSFLDGHVGSDDYSFDLNGNPTTDLNKGISEITYNHLNLPKAIVKTNGDRLEYIYTSAGEKIRLEIYDGTSALVKRKDYVADYYYEDGLLKTINHEHGRVVVNGSTFEYQYFIKDHLGNVRLAFTTLAETNLATATLEDNRASEDRREFLNTDEAITVNEPIFDHTHRVNSATPQSYRSQRLLGGNTNAKYGIAKSLSVMPGDKIRMRVYAKYPGSAGQITDQYLTNFLMSIANGTASAGTIVDGGASGSIGNGALPPTVFATDPTNGEVPHAYLNYVTFDKDYKLIEDQSQTDRVAVTTEALETGLNNSHQELIAEITIRQAGYVYIYVSNNNPTPREVYFDDLSVEHIKSPIIQLDDYYPFGKTFNSFSKEDVQHLDKKFNGMHWHDELGVNLIDFNARMYDPLIGRFTTLDPLLEKYTSASPYNFALNNPVLLIDPDGMASRYNWGSKSYYDDVNGNGTQDFNEVNVSWGQVANEYSLGNYSSVTTVAVFPQLSSGSSRLQGDVQTGSLTNLLESAKINEDVNGTYKILYAKNVDDAASQLAGLSYKVPNLIIASHGLYNKAEFSVGNTVYDNEESISKSKGLAKIAKTLAVDAEVIFTACNLGSEINGGIQLLRAVSTKFQRTVYGNRSWTYGSQRLFQGGFEEPAYYRSNVPGYHQALYPYGYANRGKWTKVTYGGIKGTQVHTILNPYFDQKGNFRYTDFIEEKK